VTVALTERDSLTTTLTPAPTAVRTEDEIVAAAEAIRPRLSELAARNDLTGDFPAESIQLIHQAGLLTATVGTRFGGPGIGHVGVQRILHTLGRGDPAAALITSMTLALHQREAAAPVLPADFYRQLLQDSAIAPTLINSLQVEPALGTPSRGGVPAATARRTPDGWKVDAHKIFSTGAPGLRWMLVLATTDEPEPRIGSFIVDATSPGVEIRPTWSAVGMRATRSDDVILRDVSVPAGWLIGATSAATGNVNPPSPGTAIPSVYLGVARAAVDWLVTFLRSRVPANLGHPLLELPRFQDALGEFELQLSTAEALLTLVSAQADEGRPVGRELSWSAKTLANRAAIGVVERAVALIGNPGLSRDNPLERHLRDVLCARVHFPQEDTVLSVLARTVTSRHQEADPALATSVRVPTPSKGSS